MTWMNQFLPENARIPMIGWDDPKSIAEIQQDIRKNGLVATEPISIRSVKKTTDLLFPIVRRNKDGDRLTELRVYRQVFNPMPGKKEAFELVSRLEMREFKEAFVIEPLVRARVAKAGGDRSLPFTSVQRFQSAPANGYWLTLTGKHKQGNTSISYGQVIYYNPTTTALKAMLPWTSPADELPTWQKLPKGRPAELVVNQTIGLEPEFEVYQLQFANKSAAVPFQLQAVSLTKSALKDGAFIDSLYLARNGLWAPALEVMQSVKRQLPPEEWTTAAEAQLEVVARHAKVTKTQAEQSWASPGQQIFATLLDGRWLRATELLENSTDDRFGIKDLLKSDPGRIKKRITAALHVNPTRTDVQCWEALLVTAKQGKAKAIAWLNKQPQDSPERHEQTLKLLNQLDGSEVSNAASEEPSANESKN